MRPWTFAIAAAACVAASTAVGHGAARADQKLTRDRQIVHVLNRLTFGARPEDVEQVRRIGIEKWIDLQLHPDRVVENPQLAAKLEPLATLHLAMWQLLDQYPAVPAALNIKLPSSRAFAMLPPAQASRLMYCAADERETTLAALDPDTRKLILTGAPPQVLDGLSEPTRQEATAARKAEDEQRQQELRRVRPPLSELLTQDQIRTMNRGTLAEKTALLDSLDPAKRPLVVRALPQQALNEVPAWRREALAANQPQQFVHSELVDQKLYRAIYSNRQLEEVLVDFWMNHFNVFNGKGPERVLLTSFERDAIRPHVFGRFHDLLLATARHPAMLFYLDNWQSQSPREDLPTPPGVRRPGLNENYGRELMELHTLGVDGGYTQADVVAVARAFTGWTIYDPQKFAEFQFNPGVHDRREKVVLGHVLPAMRGEQDGLDVIDLLSRHPSTARFISRELAQRFVADDPPPALVDRMAATFTRTDGDLRAVLETLFASPEFAADAVRQTKLKSPLEFAVSALRALNADATDTFALAQRIADLGEPLYGKIEPTGYSNTSDAWTSTASVLGRINFASALTAGQIAGVTVDRARLAAADAPAIARGLLNGPASPSTLAALQRGDGVDNKGKKGASPATLAAVILSSPDFQRR